MKKFAVICVWALLIICTTSTSAIDKINYRLPNQTYPVHYDLTLTPNVHTGENIFQGKITITIAVVIDTSEIVLHSHKLTILKATVTNQSTGVSEDLLNAYEEEREFLKLTRKNGVKFNAKTTLNLTITYSGQLREDTKGFYSCQYIDDEGNDHYLAATHFESTYARYAFPCYDEPNKRAKFTITIHHSSAYTAISNMPVNQNLSSANKTVFLTTPSMPTYILGFIVNDYEYTEASFKNLTHRVYSRPNAKNAREWPLLASLEFTRYLTDYFNIEYMLPKLDHIALPCAAAGATENWGLITYSEDNLLYDDETPNMISKIKVATTIAHEVTHQWLGNLATIRSWVYYWIKEGLATFFSYKAVNHVYAEWDIWQHYHILQYNYAMNRDDSDSPTAIASNVQTPSEIKNHATYLFYTKSVSIVFMWINALPEKVFQKGLHNFLMKNQYSSVGEEELFGAFQVELDQENKKIPATIYDMLTTWTHQGGYPILTVTRNYSDSTFTIKQEPYHRNKTLSDFKTWYVPINYVVASNPDFHDTKVTHYLLNVTETKFNDVKISSKDWLILNKQSTGYYRINYDRQNWHLIAETLIKRPSIIHYRNRAQLMDDANHLCESSHLDYSTLFELLSYLEEEDQYAPWSIAYDILVKYNKYMKSDAYYHDYKFFVAQQVRPIYKKLGPIAIPGEPIFDNFIRELVTPMACAMEVNECLEDAYNKLKNNIQANMPLYEEINCYGIRKIDDELFNILHQKLINSTDPTTRATLIYNLGCTANRNQIRKFLFSSIDKSNTLDTKERYMVLESAYSKEKVAFSACIKFLTNNWNVYIENFKSDSNIYHDLNYHIIDMVSYAFNKNQQNKLLDLVAKVKDNRHFSPSLESIVKEKIAQRTQISNKYTQQIMPWIKQYRSKAMQ